MNAGIITVNMTTKAVESFGTIMSGKLSFQGSYMETKRKFIQYLTAESIYSIYVENSGENEKDEQYVNLIFAFDTNETNNILDLAAPCTLMLRGVLKPDGVLIIGVETLPLEAGTKNSRNVLLSMGFQVGSKGIAPKLLSEEVLSVIQNLPDAKQQRDLVAKRIQNWDIYLDLLETKALEQSASLGYQGYRISENMRYLFLNIPKGMENLKHKKLRNATAKVGIPTDEEDDFDSFEKIGSMEFIDWDKHEIKINLLDEKRELMNSNDFDIPEEGILHLSRMGDLVQTRRLRGGLRKLIKGKAKNPNIENILFDDDIRMNRTENAFPFNEENLLQKSLNFYQQKAVKKAMEANDIFLIQGPPGTGKTTVIAEICYQNALNGLKTLIASQSNLAVDNALSKLVHNPNIRALRKGNMSRVETEGKYFTEDRVIDTWMKQTSESCIKDKDDLVNEQERLQSQEEAITLSLNSLESELRKSRRKLAKCKKEMEQFNEEQESLQNQEKSIKQSLEVFKNNYQKELIHFQELKETFEIVSNKRQRIFQKANRLKDHLSDSTSAKREKVVHLELLESTIIRRRKVEALDKLLQSLQTLFRTQKAQFEENQKLWNILRKLLNESQKRSHFIQSNQDADDVFPLAKGIAQFSPSAEHGIYDRLAFFEAELTKMNKELQLKSENERKLQTLASTKKLLIEELKQYSINIELMVGSERTADILSEHEVKKLIEKCHSLLLKKPSAFAKIFGMLGKWKKEIYEVAKEVFATANTIEAAIMEGEKTVQKQQSLTMDKLSFLREVYPGLLRVLSTDIDRLESKNHELNHSCHLTESECAGLKQERLLLVKEIEPSYQEIPSVSLEKQVMEGKREITSLNEKIARLDTDYASEFEKANQLFLSMQNDYDQAAQEMETKKLVLNDLNAKSSAFQQQLTEIETRYPEIVHGISSLEAIMLEEEEHQSVIKDKKEKLKQERKVFEDQRNHSSIKSSILEEWVDRLNNQDRTAKHALKQIYIDSANVIGITCVQSGARTFSEDYPDFDVVIIDEVSKATPPEILLPILKGKKIILVGDHNQLPPMVGDDTLKEVIEKEGYTEEEKIEMKEYLKESLFERLFEISLPEYKETLRVQYRMHSHIMNTINQFYENEEGLGLESGIENEDVERDHGITGEIIQRNNHIIWMDTPLHPSHYEKQAEGGTSYYNQSELEAIQSILMEINEAMAKKKEIGELGEKEKKDIGIISFYGEQVKRLDDMINFEMDQYPHLSFRIGTVDRFQGMERDIIIASFVRNNKDGDIGFAKEYKRVNVALSRAKELLIITGCSELFCERSKKRNPKAAQIYMNILKEVEKVDGRFDLLGRSLTLQ